MANLKNPRVWLHGLISALVGGAATSISTIVVAPEQFNLEGGLLNVGKVALVSGIVSAAMYLKQSPLPPMEGE
jgi:hypothetical protein